MAPELVLHAVPDCLYLDWHPAGRLTVSFWLWTPPSAGGTLPQRASIRLMAAGEPVETRVLEAAHLAALSGPPPRYLGHDVGLWLAHQVTVPQGVGVDRIEYELRVSTAGDRRSGTVSLEVVEYRQRTRLVFPVTGNFAIVFGHASEGDHLERSQAFAYDIAPLGERYELLREGDGSENCHFAGWDREVRAPAGGEVVRVQAEIPDNTAPGTLIEFEGRPEGPWAVLGNGALIDHGHSEFSLLGHLQRGSLSVRAGERIQAGQLIGRVGNSGHSSGPHLHYHLMDGPELFRSNGLPSRFDGTETGTPRRGAMERAD